MNIRKPLSYEDRQLLKQLVSNKMKERYKKDLKMKLIPINN